MTTPAPPGHFQEPYEQHEEALTWRARCSCTFAGHWRGSPDRATDDLLAHWSGDDSAGHYP